MQTQEIVVILDNIRSRENVGSIFRTADAAGVAKVYLCGITPRPSQYQVSSIKPEKPSGPRAFTGYQGETDKIAKTALGAEKWVPWEYHKQTWRLIEQLKKDGYQIIALEKTDNAKNIFELKTKSKIALVLGNEVDGLKKEIINRCDIVASIPMRGQKESLNVAVAFGVAVYNIRN